MFYTAEPTNPAEFPAVSCTEKYVLRSVFLELRERVGEPLIHVGDAEGFRGRLLAEAC